MSLPADKVHRAAQYLRMSTEHQRYSTENQASAIGLYASLHGYDVVRTYADEGVSGLSLKKRAGLQALLADVLGGHADFDTILVFDVSRWGRFQNPDQSAHYEFICTEAGVRVEYCAEVFANDGSMASSLLKALKRVMAAEYSRELSAKVIAGRLAMARRGFWVGGPAGFGLRRQIVRANGRRGAVLEYGEAKAVHSDRLILIPGPPDEVALVNRIYRMFVNAGLTRTEICRVLNAEHRLSECGRPWTEPMVTQILSNRKYVGDLVVNRSTRRLGTVRVPRKEREWFVLPGAFERIVEHRLFHAAQKRLPLAPRSMSTAEMIAAAQRLYDATGKISFGDLAAATGMPGRWAFQHRFGSLAILCAAMERPYPGRPRRPMVRLSDEEATQRLAELFNRLGYLNCHVIEADDHLPSAATYIKRFGSLDKAYARVGFVRLTAKERLSPVGRARIAAARALQSGAARTSAGKGPDATPGAAL
jgi:DNA invertase Pin-like site-specific DNA recombinase